MGVGGSPWTSPHVMDWKQRIRTERPAPRCLLSVEPLALRGSCPKRNAAKRVADAAHSPACGGGTEAVRAAHPRMARSVVSCVWSSKTVVMVLRLLRSSEKSNSLRMTGMRFMLLSASNCELSEAAAARYFLMADRLSCTGLESSSSPSFSAFSGLVVSMPCGVRAHGSG